MAKSAKRGESAPGRPGQTQADVLGLSHSRGLTYGLVFGAVVLAVALMSVRLGGPLNGFHSFNEGFYLMNGIQDATRGFFLPISAPLDANNPFVYPLVLATALRVFGESIAVARAVSVVASAVTVALTFAIGRELYNDKVGVAAAYLLAVMPGFVLVGRNIQIDALVLALMLAAIFAYLKTVRTGQAVWAVASGVLLAIGLLTKLPALLVLPVLAVWQTWRTRRLGWIAERNSLIALGTFVLAVVPWYLYRAVTSAQFVAQQSYLVGIAAWSGFEHLVYMVLLQQGWMLSPPLGLLTVAAIVLIARRRQPADKLLLVFLGVHALLYAFYNFHVYYYLPLAPFAALACARLVTAAGMRRVVVFATTALVVLTVPFALLMLGGKKFSSPQTESLPRLISTAGFDLAATDAYVLQQIYESAGPSIDYYLKREGATVRTFSSDIPKPTSGRRLVLLAGQANTPLPGVREFGSVDYSYTAPVLFGYALRQPIWLLHLFNPTVPEIVRVGPVWRFGWEDRTESPHGEVLYEVEQ